MVLTTLVGLVCMFAGYKLGFYYRGQKLDVDHWMEKDRLQKQIKQLQADATAKNTAMAAMESKAAGLELDCMAFKELVERKNSEIELLKSERTVSSTPKKLGRPRKVKTVHAAVI